MSSVSNTVTLATSNSMNRSNSENKAEVTSYTNIGNSSQSLNPAKSHTVTNGNNPKNNLKPALPQFGKKVTGTGNTAINKTRRNNFRQTPADELKRREEGFHVHFRGANVQRLTNLKQKTQVCNNMIKTVPLTQESNDIITQNTSLSLGDDNHNHDIINKADSDSNDINFENFDNLNHIITPQPGVKQIIGAPKTKSTEISDLNSQPIGVLVDSGQGPLFASDHQNPTPTTQNKWGTSVTGSQTKTSDSQANFWKQETIRIKSQDGDMIKISPGGQWNCSYKSSSESGSEQQNNLNGIQCHFEDLLKASKITSSASVDLTRTAGSELQCLASESVFLPAASFSDTINSQQQSIAASVTESNQIKTHQETIEKVITVNNNSNNNVNIVINDSNKFQNIQKTATSLKMIDEIKENDEVDSESDSQNYETDDFEAEESDAEEGKDYQSDPESAEINAKSQTNFDNINKVILDQVPDAIVKYHTVKQDNNINLNDLDSNHGSDDHFNFQPSKIDQELKELKDLVSVPIHQNSQSIQVFAQKNDMQVRQDLDFVDSQDDADVMDTQKYATISRHSASESDSEPDGQPMEIDGETSNLSNLKGLNDNSSDLTGFKKLQQLTVSKILQRIQTFELSQNRLNDLYSLLDSWERQDKIHPISVLSQQSRSELPQHLNVSKSETDKSQTFVQIDLRIKDNYGAAYESEIYAIEFLNQAGEDLMKLSEPDSQMSCIGVRQDPDVDNFTTNLQKKLLDKSNITMAKPWRCQTLQPNGNFTLSFTLRNRLGDCTDFDRQSINQLSKIRLWNGIGERGIRTLQIYLNDNYLCSRVTVPHVMTIAELAIGQPSIEIPINIKDHLASLSLSSSTMAMSQLKVNDNTDDVINI